MSGTTADGNALDSGIGFNSVNEHCLERIVSLSERMEVVASNDIFDAAGMKLWAKGLPVSRKLQDKLLRRRLARPLEASLGVESGVTPEVVLTDCRSLIEKNPGLVLFAQSSDARAVLRSIQSLPLPSPVKLLLTSAREYNQGSYRHSLATMVICAGLASKMALTERDASLLIMSGLVHDIGEIYVSPDYLNGNKAISPAEWKYVASHPRVGQAFIREFTNFPSAVADSVLHHHERLDGSGYPFQVPGEGLGRLSAVLQVADSVAAIVMRGGEAIRNRVLVALRVAPDEFDRGAVSAVSDLLRVMDSSSVVSTDSATTGDTPRGGARVKSVLERLGRVKNVADTMLCRPPSPFAADSARFVLNSLENIHKNLRSTGVSDESQLAAVENDPEIMSEVGLIVREVTWRLRNLARNVYLRTEQAGGKTELDHVNELVAVLDGAQPLLA